MMWSDFVIAPFAALEGTKMKRVTQFEIYSIGTIRSLGFMKAGDSVALRHNELAHCWTTLESFCTNVEMQKLLLEAVIEARLLQACVNSIGSDLAQKRALNVGSSLIDANGNLTEAAHADLSRGITSFETALKYGLNSLPTYVIEKIGIYATDDLLSKADEAIVQELKPYVPSKALEDFKKAGACLAFELYTACGFHGFRAVDTMLRQYCTYFSGGLSSQRDWGSYIRKLRCMPAGSARVPSKRTIELIDRVRDEDRNPLVHPETDLDALQASNAFDLCRTVIGFMATDIKNAP
jgi:hypothetical protein